MTCIKRYAILILKKQFGGSFMTARTSCRSIESLLNVKERENEQEIVNNDCCNAKMKLDRLEVITGYYCYTCGRYTNGFE